MLKIALSAAASGLLRALSARAGVSRDRILLTHAESVDWQSLTLVGERHSISLRITGSDSESVAVRLADGLEDAEFAIRGQIVADIILVGKPVGHGDGSTAITIEALTIEE
jgi:hypothetical protein